jgi:murein L,D-transpeptidase YcbB/YkuD
MIEWSPEAKLDYNAVVDIFTVEEMREAIQKVASHGLNPSFYWTKDMEKSFQNGKAGNKDFKLRTNQNFLRLLQDISSGNVNPESLSPDIKIKSKGFLTPKQLQALVVTTGQNAELLAENLAPQNPPYQALRAALARVYPACTNGEWAPLSKARKTLKLGVRDPAVTSLKKRFMFLGYRIGSLNDLVDEDVVNAINDIEWNLHIAPDGAIHPGGKIWGFLNIPCMDRVHQIQADMEKVRWFPQRFEDRFILINLAFTYFVMFDNTNGQNYVTSFRTINGRPDRKSPTMRDEIVRVIFNPFWIVPPTVFLQDKVQEIRNLPRWQIRGYFDQHNYEVWNHDFTHRLDPESIDWWAIGSAADANIFIRQRPNYWSALGVVKFDLTNSFSVYLHDTGQRELFVEPMRLLSSGCIRLEKPLDLAEYLLRGTNWDRGTIENIIAKPGQVMSRDTPVVLKNPMPVYTMFLTSQLSSDNILRFTFDLYDQNQEILANFEPAL